MKAPPLAKDLVITDGNIAGYFERDERQKPEGIRLCDAETGTWVATASKMSEWMPFPFARLEITGDVFIPNLAGNQNTERGGLSPEFLRSEEWRGVQERLFEQFSPKLARMLGDEGVIRSDPLGRTIRQVIFGFNAVYGPPDAAVPIPPGVQPPPGFPGEEGGEDEPGESGGRKPPKGKHPKRRKSRAKRFCYKGRTYFLGTMNLGSSKTAEFSPPNIVNVNTRDPLIDRFKSASAALQNHVLRAVIAALERLVDENVADIRTYDMAVNEAVERFYAEGEKRRA